MKTKLNEVAEATGNDKLEVLRKYPELKQILKLCYDPHMKYYMVDPDIAFTPGSTQSLFMKGGELPSSAMDLLLSLSDRSLSGHAARDAVTEYIQDLGEDHSDIFVGIINKDLRLGLGAKSINKVWPGLIPAIKGGNGKKPAIPLCKTFKPEKAGYPLLASIKHDGVRGRSVDNEILSRSYKKINGMEHIEKELEKYPCNLDGEIVVPGNQFDSASGLIRNLDPVPEAVYMVFDADLPGGKYERNLVLNQFEFSKSVKLIWQEVINNETDLFEFYDKAVSDGHEGIVICSRDGAYEDKRCWWRLVPLKSADCRVIGFFEGKGKFKNSLGGIIVDYKGHEVKVGSGFQEIATFDLPDNKKDKMTLDEHMEYNETVRSYIWTHQTEFLSRIAECQFKEETKAGSMRQPTFKCWRFDKSEPNFDS